MASKILNSGAVRRAQTPQQSQSITLGTNEVPVFLIIGDSTSVGWTNFWDTGSYGGEAWAAYRYTPMNRVPEVGSLTFANTPSIAKIWSKFQHRNTDSGVESVDRGIRETTSDGTRTVGWQDADPRMGGGGLQWNTDPGGTDVTSTNFPYASESGDFTNKALIGSPVWNFLLDIETLFVDSNYDAVQPHCIYLGKSSSRFSAGLQSGALGSPWKTAWNTDTGGSSDLQASNGSLYEFYKEYYVKPAINNLRNAGKTPLICGLIVMLGGNDAGTQTNDILTASFSTPFPNGPGGDLTDDIWNLAKGYYEDLKDDLCSYMGITDVPIVGYIPWRPDDESVVNYDAIQILRDDFLDLFTNTFSTGILIDPLTLQRDSPSFNGNSDGIHFTPRGTMAYGKMLAAAYRKLLARKDVVVTAYDVTGNIT